LANKIKSGDEYTREQFERVDREDLYEQLKNSDNILYDLQDVDLVNETLMELVFGYEDDALINADDTINVSYVDPSVIRVMLSNIDFENPQNN
jgi:hypothetical protein